MLRDISHSIDIDAPQARVWTVLTTEGLVEEWLGCIGFRPEVGALFFMQPDPAKRAEKNMQGATHCEIELLEEPDLIRFSWFYPDTPRTHVTIELCERAAGSTTVRLTHAGWDQFREDDVRAIRDMLDGGWSSFVLPGLKRVSESDDQQRG